MTKYLTRRLIILLSTCGAVLGPVPARAQTATLPGSNAASAVTTSAVAVGVGLGPATGDNDTTATFVSVRIPFRHLWAVEGEVGRMSFGSSFGPIAVGGSAARQDVTAESETGATLALAALIIRGQSGRIGAYVGGGGGFERVRQHDRRTHSPCEPILAGGCQFRPPPGTTEQSFQWTNAVVHLTTGAEVEVLPRIHAFGSVRLSSASTAMFGFTGGVRASLGTRTFLRHEPRRVPVTAASTAGQRVVVTMRDGARRRGSLVSLSDTEVVLRTGRDRQTMALTDVRRVETARISAATAAWRGLGIGAAAGVFASMCDTSGDDCPNRFAWAPIGMAIGGGAGAALGAGIAALVRSGRRDEIGVLFEAPASTPTVYLAPIVDRSRKGMALAMTW